jgi:hypothetical protein
MVSFSPSLFSRKIREEFPNPIQGIGKDMRGTQPGFLPGRVREECVKADPFNPIAGTGRFG